MPQAEHSVTIQQPPETVFAYLVDGEKCTEWRAGCARHQAHLG